MLSRACHRCKGTTHGPEKHLLTCQNCHKSWHDCCHIPAIQDLEIQIRIRGSIRPLITKPGGTEERNDPNQLSLENWHCRRCCKTQDLPNARSSVKKPNQPNPEPLDDVKVVQDQSVMIISDSDSDDIQFIGSRLSAGARQQVVQRPNPSTLDSTIERGPLQTYPAPLIVPVAEGLVTSLPSSKTRISEDGPRVPVLPWPAPQSFVTKNELPSLNHVPHVQHIARPQQNAASEMTTLKIVRKARKVTYRPPLSVTPPEISVSLSPASRSSTGPLTLADFVSELRDRNANTLLVTREYDSLTLVSANLRQWLTVGNQDGAEEVMRLADGRVSNQKETEMVAQARSQRKKFKGRRFDTEKYDPDILIFP
ncbi:hexose transporter [Lentinula edodes]|uniref:Hexose transporter n=1 Tax=Lentinula edodes TaxID=5353 RepID=A0A1Q3EF53_LENED|nr:hexose transporter [Lentinula edodes]